MYTIIYKILTQVSLYQQIRYMHMYVIKICILPEFTQYYVNLNPFLNSLMLVGSAVDHYPMFFELWIYMHMFYHKVNIL